MSAAKAAGAKLAVVMERAATARAFFKVIVIYIPLNGSRTTRYSNNK
jgi:hypothetical protein